ncbi:MAG: mechanosensitive ion channel family protein, partial [Ignavibacteriaceae bacterium]|nr:mechanosensitive ion channel family protein [Ignavibacteriaceae bacterium]
MSKIFLLTILCMISLQGSSLFGQKSNSPDSLAEKTREVKSIYKEVAKYPLQPVETTSPRSTLQNFLENIYRAHKILMLADAENRQTKGIFTPDSIELKAREAEEFFQRGARCLNLIDIPEALIENIGNRRALKLKEILDKIELPPFNKVPDVDELEIEKEDGTVAKLLRWRIPKTDIVIARVEDGPRKNEYLFTPETIKRLDEFYYKVEELPYITGKYATPGFYNFFISRPGKLLPPKWAEWLPEWSYNSFLEQTIWKWLFFIIYIIISILVFIRFYKWFNPWDLTIGPIKRNLRRIISIFLLLIIILGLYLLDTEHINMSGIAKIILTIPGATLFWLLLAIFLLMIFKLFAEIIIASPKINPVDIQASYIRAVFTVIGFLLATIIFIYGLSRIGVSLAPLLAGVGIGGFAIAIAARPTLENIIGSFMIFADKPFKVGQRIKVTNYDGTVEEIGLRSTKIRLLNGNLTSIPNEKMVTLEIENIARRPYIRRTFNICITYDTPPDKIIRAVKLLGEILSVPQKTEL